MSNQRDEISIRAAATEDVDALAFIHSVSWQAAYKGILSDEQLSTFTPESRRLTFAKLVLANPPSTYLLEFHQLPVAFVAFGRYRDDDIDTSDTGEIRALYVLPEQWRKGFGKRLCDVAELSLGEKGYSRVVAWVLDANQRAKEFYANSGYRVDGATKVLHIGLPILAVRMSKKIEPVNATGALK